MFPYSKNKIPEVNMSITSKYEDSDIILWETIVSNDEEKLIKIWTHLVITLHPNSIFKLKNIDSWELFKWSMTIDSNFDFLVRSWKSQSKLLRSSLFIKKLDNKTKIVSLKWISNITIYNKTFWLSNNYWVSLDEKDIYNWNHFEILEKSAYWNVPVNKLIDNNLEFNSPKYIWKIDNISESFIFFDKKRENKKIINVYNKYNNCLNILDDLNILDNFKNEKSKKYSSVRQHCINEDLLKEENLASNLYKHLSSIDNLEYRYDLLKLFNTIKNKKTTLTLEQITKLLNESIEKSDVYLAWFFITELKSQIKNKKNISLQILLNTFINVDALSSKNIFIVNRELIETRWLLEDLILKQSNKQNNQYIWGLSDFHFIFAQNLLSEKKYKLLDYIFEKRIFFDIEKKWMTISKSYNDFINKTKILRQAYLLSKKWIHTSAFDQKTEMIKMAASKQKNEDKISTLINEFKTIKKRASNTFNYNLIKDRFANHWINIQKSNISAHIKSWNTFTINDISLNNEKYILEYNFEKNTVDNIKKNDWNEIIANWSIPLEMLKWTIIKDLKPSYIDTQVASILPSFTEKDFSYDIFLEKELIKKYLQSINIWTDSATISKLNDNIYEIKAAVLNYKNKRDIKFSFIIALNEWSVSNIRLDSAKNQKIFTKVNYARNLEWILKRTYEIMDIRNANIAKTINLLEDFDINQNNISIDSLERDWFLINKTIAYKAWNWKLKWVFYAEKWIFEKATFDLNDIHETWIRITPNKLRNYVFDIKTEETERIENEQQEKFEFIKRFIDYTNIPEELINWDWIND